MPNGRPPITSDKLVRLQDCFIRQLGASATAREVGVHRNTVNNYFNSFKVDGSVAENFMYSVSDRPTHLVRAARIVLPPKLAIRLTTPAAPWVARTKSEQIDLQAISLLVPSSTPGYEDIRQEIILALLEGRVSVEELKERRNIRTFGTKYYRENFEQRGHAISLNQPMRSGARWDEVLSSTNSPWH